MVKNMLKSSVSFLVLISFISSIDPSHAGNAGGGEKDPGKNGIRVQRKQQNTGLNFQEVAQNPEERVLAVLYERVKEPDKELQKAQVLLELGPEGLGLVLNQGISSGRVPLKVLLAPETELDLQCISKQFDKVVRAYRQNTLNYITSMRNEELKNLQSSHLKQFLLNPESFFLLHKRLAYLYVNFVQSPETDLILRRYTFLIRDNKEFQPFFAKMCVEDLNPLKNYEEVLFANGIIMHSTDCQEYILQQRQKTSILEKNGYFWQMNSYVGDIKDKDQSVYLHEILNFPEFVEDPKNFQALHQYLMTTRYMSKSNHPSAKQEKRKLEIFSSSLFEYFENKINKLRKKGYEVFAEKNPHFMNQPFWSIYDTSGKNNNNQLRLLERIADTPLVKQLNREKIKVFWAYITKRYPDLYSDYRVSMANLFNVLPHSIPNEVANLYNGVDPNHLDRVMLQVVEPYMNVNNYKEALGVLEHSYTIGEQLKSPFRFQILFKLAECSLASPGLGSLQKAGEYIEILLTEFNFGRKTDELDTPFHAKVPGEFPTLPGSDAGSHDPNVLKDRLSKKQVDTLQLGFILRRNKVANVQEAMERLEPHEIFYGKFSEPILRILKSSLPPQTLSKDLRKLLAHKAEKGFSLDFFKTRQKMLTKYGDVYKYFLKGYFKKNPLKARKFQKLEKKALTSGK